MDEQAQIERCIAIGQAAAERYKTATTKAERDRAWDDMAKADMLMVRARIRLMNDKRKGRK